jgi:hypothetical protein
MPESPARQPFESDGASLAATAVRDAAAPALSSSNALARFEFEAGRGNEGTKILMVEWSDTASTLPSVGWEISWEGKSTTVSERDGAEGKSHRLYFLLPPGATIPPIVKIGQKGGEIIQTNPLPAIFPPELGASARAAGKRGVLHTKWGKQRLSVLEKEIEREMKTNGEGIALEMAMKEKEWIEDNFGVGSKTVPETEPSTPTSPRSPGGGRLAEKLRGLKLGTSASDLNARAPGKILLTRPLGTIMNFVNISTAPTRDPAAHLLSPDTGDVAVSSFSLFHGGQSRPVPRAVAQAPPSYILAQQAEAGANQWDALAPTKTATKVASEDSENEPDDDLFAVNMSPRSPDMAKSPFSLVTTEAVPWR